MGKVDDHRAALVGRRDWLPYLAANSGLPGPRASAGTALTGLLGDGTAVIQAVRQFISGPGALPPDGPDARSSKA